MLSQHPNRVKWGLLAATLTTGGLTGAASWWANDVMKYNAAENKPKYNSINDIYQQWVAECTEIFVVVDPNCIMIKDRPDHQKSVCNEYKSLLLQCELVYLCDNAYRCEAVPAFLLNDLNKCNPELMTNYTNICATIYDVKARPLALPLMAGFITIVLLAGACTVKKPPADDDLQTALIPSEKGGEKEKRRVAVVVHASSAHAAWFSSKKVAPNDPLKKENGVTAEPEKLSCSASARS